jgi:hypothetical protein
VEYETVLGTIAINSGRHYWEIKIDKFVELDDIIIGVSQKGMDIHSRPFDTGKFWGWICTGGRKIYPSAPGGPPTAKEYGGCAKIGDNIGVLFEFKNGMGSLSFLKNGVSNRFLDSYFNTFVESSRCLLQQYTTRPVQSMCLPLLWRGVNNFKSSCHPRGIGFTKLNQSTSYEHKLR